MALTSRGGAATDTGIVHAARLWSDACRSCSDEAGKRLRHKGDVAVPQGGHACDEHGDCCWNYDATTGLAALFDFATLLACGAMLVDHAVTRLQKSLRHKG